MRRVVLAGTVATSLLTGAAAGLVLGVPITAHSGERLASTTPTASIATAAAAAGAPAIAAPVQAAPSSAPVAAPAIAPAVAPVTSIVHANVSTPASVNTKVAGTDGTGGELAVVASALHMALSNLTAALADGQTLAQIATSAGVDPAKLIATVVNDATNKINTAVTLGMLARAQADKIMAMLPSLVTDVVNHSFRDIDEGLGAGSKLPVSLGSLGDLASLGNFANLGNLANLGKLPDLGKFANLGNMGDLPKLTEMGSAAGNFSSFFSNMFGSFGHLANVSAGAGSQAGTGATVDPQALISDLVSMATAAVNSALSAGLLTPTQANTILASLTPTITDLVHKLLDAGLNLGNEAAGWASFASSWMGHHQ
jgi:hypothetical protein